MVIEELLAVLLRLERLDVRRLDSIDDASALRHSVPLAFGRVDREEVFAEVLAHHYLLPKDLLEVLEVYLMVLEGNFLKHCFYKLNLLVFFKYVDGEINRLCPPFGEADD